MSWSTAIRDRWRAFWAARLGWTLDEFNAAWHDLNARLLIVEKRCEALTPSEWAYRRK